MLKIEVIANPSALAGVPMGTQIDEAMAAIGFARVGLVNAQAPVDRYIARDKTDAEVAAISAPAQQAATQEAIETTTGAEPATTRKRRTKAEIAADEAKQQISTSPEDRKQDVADEKAETAKAGETLTLDNVRNALGGYVEKFGMKAVQEDGQQLFKMLFGDAAPAKITDLPTDQETLKKVVDGIAEMTSKNPFGRDLVKG